MAKKESITKTEAVRQAFTKLGQGASADTVIPFVKETFGHALSRSHFFNIKTTLSKKEKRRGRPKKIQTETTAPTTSAAPKVRLAINLADIQTIKHLAERYGPQSIHSLIELVGK